VARDEREPRPADEDYYVDRTEWVRQGDLFQEVPLGYPFPPEALDQSEGKRKFLSGPFDTGFGMLISPTCSMAAQGEEGRYAHPVRVLAPVQPLALVVEEGAIKAEAVAGIRRYDNSANYFYVPSLPEAQLPESVALLYMPITIHHDYLVERRVAQLSRAAAIHLKRQLASHFGGELFGHEDFDD